MQKVLKTVSFLMICTMLVGVILTAGCFGGGSDSWVGALLGAVVIAAVITATGGSGAPMIFAANVKHPTAEIRFADSPTSKFIGRITLSHNNTRKVNLLVSDDKKSLKLNTTIDGVTPGDQQVLIEILPEGSDQPMLKAIATPTVPAGNVNIEPAVNFETTARVLAYENWDGKDTSSFAKFNPPVASITDLADKIAAQVIASSTNANGEIIPVATFTFTNEIIAEAG